MKTSISFIIIITLFIGCTIKAQVSDVASQINFDLNNTKFNNRYYLQIQFKDIPDIDVQNNMKKDGIILLEYLNDNKYLVSASVGFNNLIDKYEIIKITQPSDLRKTEPQLLKEILANSDDTNDYKMIIVLYQDDITHVEIVQEIQRMKLEIIYLVSSLNHFVIKANNKVISALGKMPWVKYLCQLPPPVVENNLVEKSNHRANVVSALYSGARGLSGKGIKIGEWDSGPLGTHIDLSGNTTLRENKVNVSNHATHVAGTVLGTGVIDPVTTGMAPNAKILSWDFYDWVPYEMDTCYKYDSIVMTTNSWAYTPSPIGVGIPYDSCKNRGNYDIYSYLFDRLVRLHPNFIHCFAAGNYQSQCNRGGFRTVSSGPQSAKNLIIVGALYTTDQMSGFSSWGPIRDGRIKPEVCGVGVSVYSTTVNNTYGYYSGTSMACPGVAGTIALLYEDFRKIHKKDPDASTLKAIVCNTADDLGNAGPDYKFGFGRINALRAAEVIENSQFYFDSLTNNNVKTYSLNVPSGLKQLKLMLCWSDVPASDVKPYDSVSLINHLDLKVTDTLNNTWYPLILDTSNYTKTAYMAVDSINNIEQIVINNPYQGKFNIFVYGKRIPIGYQTFTLTYDLIAPDITVTYPVGNESFVPGTVETVYWDAYGVSNNFKLEYSTDNGTSWTTINSNVNVSQRYYSWTVPNIISSKYLIRVSSGSMSDVCDTNFSVMKKPASLFSKACDGQIHLFWNALAESKSYDVFMSVDGYMKVMGHTTDTFYTITGLDNKKSYYFSINAYDSALARSPRILASLYKPDSTTYPPTILYQSKSDTVCPNTNKTLSVSITGTNPIYKIWQISKDNGQSWNDIIGATDTFLNLSNIKIQDNGWLYRIFLRNPCMGIVYSDPIRINVDSGFKFTVFPSDLSTCIGQKGVLTAHAISLTLFNSIWQKSSNGTNWFALQGKTSDSLIFDSLTMADNAYYRFFVSNMCFNDSISTKITIYYPLTVNIQTSADTICYGGNVTLYAKASGGDSLHYFYFWNDTTITEDSLTAKLYTSKTFKVSVFDSCSNHAVDDSVLIFVKDPLSVKIKASSDTICIGQNVDLEAIISGGGSSLYYFWSNNEKSKIINVKPTVTTTYFLNLTDSCSSNLAFDSFTIVVRPELKVEIEAINDTICAGNTAIFSSKASGGYMSHYVVSWNHGANGDSLKFIPDSSLWVYATLTDNCTSLTASDSEYIYVRPPLQIKALTLNDTLCYGNVANIYTIQNGGLRQQYSYNWFGSSVNDSFIVEKLFSTKKYIVEISDNCSSKNAKDSVLIFVKLPLSVNISSIEDTVCNGAMVLLSATIKGGDSVNYSYTWNHVADDTANVSGIVWGNKLFKVVADDKCSDSLASDSLMIFSYQLNSGFSQQEITYRNVQFLPFDTMYVQYKWQFGDGDSSNLIYPLHLYKNNGNYHVCLTVTNFEGCDSTFCKDIYVENPIVNNNEINQWMIFPNPNNGQFRILPIKYNGVYEYTLHSSLGETIVKGQALGLKEISLRGLDRGIYLLTILSNSSVKSFKIIIQ